MSTLTNLKARIAADLDRTDLTSEIGDAITDAIEFYQDTLFIKESRDLTFTTVASQQTYTSSDAADIANVRNIYNVFSNDGTRTRELRPYTSDAMELMSDSSAANGEPYAYSWFDETVFLYPIPDATTWTIRIHCQIAAAAPASDGETDNIWMTRGKELIRAKAKALIFDHVTLEPEQMPRMEARAEEQYMRLLGRQNLSAGTGQVEATCF